MLKKILKTVSVILILAQIFGCSKKDEEKNITYYREEAVSLPDDIIMFHDMMEMPNGNISILADTKTEIGRIFELNSDTNSWEVKNEKWESLENSVPFDEKFLEEDSGFASVLYNALLAESEEDASSLRPGYFVINKDGVIEELTLDLSEGYESEEYNLFTLMENYNKQLIGADNAQLIYSFDMNGNIKYINKDIKTLNTEIVKMIEIEDLIYTVLDNGEVYCMEPGSGVMAEGNNSVIEYLQCEEEDYTSYSLYKDPAGGKLYKLTKEALYCYDLGKKAEEKLFDTRFYDLKNGNNFQMLVSKDGTVYLSYILSSGEIRMSEYTYDKNGIEVRKEPLTVYSLTENYVLEKLVDAFNVEHPDTIAEVTYGYTSDDGKTKEDAVQLLNTELLSGKGPDIIIMDGLSEESYYSENMLKDLNDIIDEGHMQKIYSNMLHPYSKQEGQYAIPLGFQIYGIIGKKEIVNVFKDTDAFLGMIEAENTDFVISDYNLSESANILYAQNMSKCISDKNVNKENLRELFGYFKRIYDISGNSFGENNKNDSLFEYYETSSMDTAVQWIYYDNLPFVVAPYFNKDSFFAAKYLCDKEGYAQEYVSENGDLVYADKMVVSVSGQSAKDNEISEFLEFILTDGQDIICQSLQMLPSNRDKLSGLLVDQNHQEPYALSEFGYGDNPDMISIYGIPLNQTDFENFEKKLGTAKKQGNTEINVKDIVLKGAGDYCLGDKSLEDAVGNVTNQMVLQFKE